MPDSKKVAIMSRKFNYATDMLSLYSCKSPHVLQIGIPEEFLSEGVYEIKLNHVIGIFIVELCVLFLDSFLFFVSTMVIKAEKKMSTDLYRSNTLHMQRLNMLT